MKKTFEGLSIGLLVGILDVAMFKFVIGIPVTLLDALGAMAFWIAAGFLTHTSGMTIQSILKGVIVAVAMGIAWLVDAVNRGKPDEVWFLLGIFVVYGAITGFLSGRVTRMRKNLQKQQTPMFS